MTDQFFFTVEKTDGKARLGPLSTPHGDIRTPAFMPVGTAGTVKGLYRRSGAGTAAADIILGNIYHLMLRPGAEAVAELGGLHKFIGWDGPILTDSGGFQIMSLAKLRKIDESRARPSSRISTDRRHELTPERAMEIQRLLGSDIQMQLDECLLYPHSDERMPSARCELSLRWAERSRTRLRKPAGPRSFGIVQGGVDASCARSRPKGSSTSASRAMRSAALRWAKARR